MDGLEKIIGKIKEDADASASLIISEAEKKASEIISEAEVQSDLKAREIIDAAEKKRDAMIMKAHSDGNLLRKKKILAKKVEIVNSTITRALEKFMRDNPEEYFESMIKLASEYSFAGEQKMVFSDRDINRLPSWFEDKLKKTLNNDAQVSICGGGSFDGGFLLIGTDIVENCTLEALVADASTEIKDELYRLLFT